MESQSLVNEDIYFFDSNNFIHPDLMNFDSSTYLPGREDVPLTQEAV